MAKPRATDFDLWQMRRDGFTNREIATYYGLSQSGVRGRISRYRRSLKAQQRLSIDAPLWNNVHEVIDEDDIAQHIGIGENWITTHVFIHAYPPSHIDFKYVSQPFSRFESVEKRAIGNGIENYSYVWYNNGYWYYGIEVISP